MHQNAIASISGQIKSILNTCIPNDSVLYSSDLFEAGQRLASEIVKHKGTWISESDAHTLIYSYLMELLKRFEEQGVDTYEHKNFSALLNTDEAGLEFSSFIASLPRQYDVYFPLPNLKTETNLRVDHDERWSLLQENRDDIEPARGLLSIAATPAYYFKVRINGFLGFRSSSLGMNEALSVLKNFVERGISERFFTRFNLQPRGFTPGAAPLNRTCAFSVRDFWGREERVSYDLSLEVSHLLKSIIFSPSSRISPEQPLDLNSDYANQYLNTLHILTRAKGEFGKRLRAASEWHFDSLASEQQSISLIQITIGLESIYGDETSSGGLTEALSDRCSYSIAKNTTERTTIKREFKELYKLRSKIVHGVSKQLSAQELKYLEYGENLLKRSLMREILICDAD